MALAFFSSSSVIMQLLLASLAAILETAADHLLFFTIAGWLLT